MHDLAGSARLAAFEHGPNSRPSGPAEPVFWCGLPWLTIEGPDEDTLIVRAVGAVEGMSSELLWDALEWALERADGRLVVADLSGVVVFDQNAIDAVTLVARASSRRRASLCTFVDPHSPLEQQFAGLP